MTDQDIKRIEEAAKSYSPCLIGLKGIQSRSPLRTQLSKHPGSRGREERAE